MLVIAGTITIDPTKLEEAKQAAAIMMAETHKEPGNVQYVFSGSFSSEGVHAVRGVANTTTCIAWRS